MEDYYRRLYESLKMAHQRLEMEILERNSKIVLLEAEKKQWVIEKLVQQGIIQDALNKANALSNKYLEENAQLREEVKRLRDGNHDKLVNKDNIDS